MDDTVQLMHSPEMLAEPLPRSGDVHPAAEEDAQEPADFGALADAQKQVVTRAQILASGATRGELRWKLGRSWRVVLPGVVLMSPGLPTLDQRLIAALLFAGPASWLAGPTAAHLHGVPGVPDPGQMQRVHVLVPPPLRPRDALWVSVRRTHLVTEPLVERDALRFSCRPRAVVDAAAMSRSDADLRAVIIGALQKRLVRPEDLCHWIEIRQSARRMLLRRALAEAMSGVWSVPEGDLLHLMRRSKVLPEPMANPSLTDAQGRRLTTPDVWIDDVALAVMVHSREFHEGAEAWERTVEQDTDLSALRVVVVAVTPRTIASRPEAVLRRIESAYLQARAVGFRAPVIATRREGPFSPPGSR